MPRQARIVVPGELFHVTQRGNYQQIIFEEDQERIGYLKLIDTYSQKYGLEVFSYCLMDNHVHFIVRPQTKQALAQTFCRAHQRYSILFHKKRNKKGHLWQERFYSCLLSGDHISAAVRYVENNPVRAKIVNNPWDYPWSSARAHLGQHFKMLRLADISEYINVKTWKEFLVDKEDDELIKKIREETNRGLVLGPRKFIECLEQKLGRNILPRPRGRSRLEIN